MKDFEFKTSSSDIVVVSAPDNMKDKILIYEKPKDKPVKVTRPLTKKRERIFL